MIGDDIVKDTTNQWVEKLTIAQRSGGVTLSETDCYVLKLYLEALLKKAYDRSNSVDAKPAHDRRDVVL